MLEGKPAGMDREPQNIQVYLMEMEGGVAICLRDEDGALLEASQKESKVKTEPEKGETDQMPWEAACEDRISTGTRTEGI